MFLRGIKKEEIDRRSKKLRKNGIRPAPNSAHKIFAPIFADSLCDLHHSQIFNSGQNQLRQEHLKVACEKYMGFVNSFALQPDFLVQSERK